MKDWKALNFETKNQNRDGKIKRKRDINTNRKIESQTDKEEQLWKDWKAPNFETKKKIEMDRDRDTQARTDKYTKDSNTDGRVITKCYKFRNKSKASNGKT